MEFPNESRASKKFTVQSRVKTLEKIANALKNDERIAATVLVGSGSYNFKDHFSDIDLVVVVYDPYVEQVFVDWNQTAQELLPVVASSKRIIGSNNYLYPFFLEDFLEIDVGFRALSEITAKRKHWKVLFDKSKSVESKLALSWKQRTLEPTEEEFSTIANSIWFLVLHATIALNRGKIWRALLEIEQIRNRTIIMAAMNTDFRIKRFQEIDKLHSKVQKELEKTLVTEFSYEHLFQKLTLLTYLFFKVARAKAAELGFTYSEHLEKKLEALLATYPTNEKDLE